MNVPLKILCIDDAEDEFVLIQGFLDSIRSSRTAYEVEWAATYSTALERLAHADYDVCLVDFQLGGQNGLDLIREVRQNNQDMPMILMTGHGTHDVDVEAMQLGAADYIDKVGLTAASLERSLRYAVEHSRALTALRQAQQSIRESEKRFRALVEKGSDFVLLVDEHGVIGYASPSFQHKMGYPDTALTGNAVQSLVHEDDVGIIDRALMALLDSPGRVTSSQLRLQHHDGSWRWVEVTGTNLLDERGVKGLVLNAHDITAHKEAREAEYEQRILAESLLDTAAILGSTLNFDTVLERILANVERVIPHDTASILVLEGDQTQTVGVYGYHDPGVESALHNSSITVEQSPLLKKIISTREILVIPIVDDSLRVTPITHELNSYIGVPVMSGKDVIAFLNLGSYSAGFFGPEHIRPLQAFAHQAAFAIQNARAYEQAQAYAALEERQRLARELHDAVSQTLFSANVIAETLPRLWDIDADDAKRETLKLARLTKGALAEMRTLLLELRPATLLDTDFSILLKHLVAATASRTDAAFDFNPTGPEIKLPPDVQLGLYRIVQEALNNIIKHARATQVQIHMERRADRITMRVRDDGRGFDVNDPPNKGRMGLGILEERAASIQASVKIESEIGSGTIISIHWQKNGLN
jgi:PAS domain S-box-containing protein